MVDCSYVLLHRFLDDAADAYAVDAVLLSRLTPPSPLTAGHDSGRYPEDHSMNAIPSTAPISAVPVSSLQTTLFTGTDVTPHLTPRAAFQAALHGRISLRDSRTAQAQALGRIPDYLASSAAPVVDVERDVAGGFAAWVRDGMPLTHG